MKNKNIKRLISLMEEANESPSYIIGWLSSMIDTAATGYPVKGYTIQHDIDYGIKFYEDKSLLNGRKNLVDSELISSIINSGGKE
jgi:hypothetical protein